ncbi:hypothetical protein GCK72_021948 [Caenorhabditis remanei]|uniref:Sugar phosphate phosphatase n=1 Tax=Caenorhabditis remanei TaxID=31234 RepID=A0A6A5GM44_CAERE|nr:hypothetical protein GCK72_021948 [Caenorhabditis remanei]KAF1755379.1 hypothetical protein GCK72_021948 [Caenorhabditis remanei]
MNITDEYDHLAPKLIGKKEGTFAYFTVRDRWPKIVTSLVDQLARRRAELIEQYGNGVERDIADILEKFAKLRYEIMTDKALCNLCEDRLDGRKWREMLNDMRTGIMPNDTEELTYFKGPWLFVECFLYRYIYSAFNITNHLGQMDYFEESKKKNFMDHLPQIEESAAFLMKISAKDAPVHELFGINTILKSSLWGNRADMSLTGGDDHTMKMSSIAASSKLADFVLIDDVNELICKVLGPLQINEKKLKNRRVDIVLDNAGVELAGDLVLAEFLLARGFADKVIVHGKAIPWFVSDTTENDFNWVVDQLKEAGPESTKFGEQLKKRIENMEIIFKCDLFWISPHPYYIMEKEAPELFEELTTSSLLIFKGDLNYRKLVGDRDWDLDTSFKTACRGFAPCPFFALRTLKAETVAGLSAASIDKLLAKFDEDNSWMTSGEYAVCQLGGV